MVIKTPWTLLFMLPIIGVVIVDLKFDLHHDKELTKSYYIGQNNAKPPGEFFIHVLIVLSSISLI